MREGAFYEPGSMRFSRLAFAMRERAFYESGSMHGHVTADGTWTSNFRRHSRVMMYQVAKLGLLCSAVCTHCIDLGGSPTFAPPSF